MKTIELTQGRFATVDDGDFDELNRHKWCISGAGYAVRKSFFKTIGMHAAIMGTPDGMHTDHINGDKLDNRRENLRICTPSQNQQNRSNQKNNKIGYKGVGWNSTANKWLARITVRGEQVHLGYFETAEDAARAYDQAAKDLHGEYAFLNFPE